MNTKGSFAKKRQARRTLRFKKKLCVGGGLLTILGINPREEGTSAIFGFRGGGGKEESCARRKAKKINVLWRGQHLRRGQKSAASAYIRERMKKRKRVPEGRKIMYRKSRFAHRRGSSRHAGRFQKTRKTL